MLYKYYQSIYQAFISASNPGNFAHICRDPPRLIAGRSRIFIAFLARIASN
jgi:hypothetical protein